MTVTAPLIHPTTECLRHESEKSDSHCLLHPLGYHDDPLVCLKVHYSPYHICRGPHSFKAHPILQKNSPPRRGLALLSGQGSELFLPQTALQLAGGREVHASTIF